MEYEDVELYAWIGADDSITDPRTDAIGLKQAHCPAGMIPMVAVHREKMEQGYIVAQMEQLTKRTGVPRGAGTVPVRGRGAAGGRDLKRVFASETAVPF